MTVAGRDRDRPGADAWELDLSVPAVDRPELGRGGDGCGERREDEHWDDQAAQGPQQ